MEIKASNKIFVSADKSRHISGAEANPDVSIIGLENKRNSVLD